jgi:hypothetical protein
LLRGRVDRIDGATGELLHRYSTVHEPGGVLPVACKTRRASRCPPCAEVYSADAYQLNTLDAHHTHTTQNTAHSTAAQHSSRPRC